MRVHRAPEPRIPVVLAIGLFAAVAGWVLVRATIGRAPAGSEVASHEGEAVEAIGAANDDANREANANVEADVTASVEVGVGADAVDADAGANTAANEPEPDVAEEPSPQTPIPTPPSNVPSGTPSSTESTLVRRGRVAYIRCGDTDRCPRDAALEEAAWAIVDALPSCARLAGQTGSADVRFHFEAETVEVRFRDHGDRPLAIPALRACLVGPSASLRTTLTPRPLTASFRFDLVAE